ncbi:MAG TPA: hypothetical protein ENJ50_02100, partial [Planctomycetaceae bacterium]|nr:hypothetical protein [Planctomycetaceae bacterium]
MRLDRLATNDRLPVLLSTTESPGTSEAATTRWLVPRGAVDPENVPIAGLGGVSKSDGLTSQTFYDDDLTDNVGL